MTGRFNTYLLDTGATISILKIDKLLPEIQINDLFPCRISGISKGLISSFGTVESELLIDRYALKHTFHIVDEDFPIPCDGIIGLDFIKRFRCCMDYGNQWKLTIRTHAFGNIVTEIYETPDGSSLTIPARCEVIRRIEIAPGYGDVYIKNQEIADGIFVGRTIISRSEPYVRVVNTNDEIAVLSNVVVESENLSNYEVYDPSEISREDRTDVLEKLRKNFPPHVANKLDKLCSDYLDVFALETDTISYNNFYKQKLILKDNTPVHIKNYRIPKFQKDIIDQKIETMRKNNTISPSISEYNSPILLVPKKSLPGSSEKRFRFVVDYRHLNKNLVADSYPLPRMDDILDQLGNSKFFSIIDLLNGFYQIELDEESKDLTTFSTDKGSFKFNSIPFGLKIGPSSFQRMMSLAFSGLEPLHYFIYMDDLIITATTENKMIHSLQEVFKICRKYNLKLHPEKCQFFLKEVTYLGHRCTENGLLPDDSKIDKVLNYPRPIDADSCKRFTAFCNYYRRFIPKFTHHAFHLTRLTKKGVKFEWTDRCENAFQYLKKSLVNPPILKYPDFNKQFIITTDASKIACGAVLSQNYDGVDMPIAYASRPFTPGERNKSTPEQELAAIHWALQYFRPYIYGYKFLIKTDHRPLIYLYTMKNPNSKLIRMRLDLEEYDFEIQHIPGKDNVSADALSRINFEDIKKLSAKIQIINKMTTRSETRKNIETTENYKETAHMKYRHVDCKDLKVVEVLNPIEVKSLPRIIFYTRHGTPRCIVKLKRRTLLKVNLLEFIVNDNLDLGKMLSVLDAKASDIDFKELQLSLNDEIFELICIQKFKEIANRNIKTLKIMLTPSVTYIDNDEDKINLMKKFHDDSLFGGHCGIRRLYNKIRLKYFWTNMTKDITSYVKSCEKCQTNKTLPRTKEKMTITPTPQTAFDIVLVDTIGPLTKSDKGNTYAVTLICDLTKYLVTVALPDKKAANIAKAVFENFVLTYGPMKQLLSDKGSEYVNSIMDDLCKLLNVTKNVSTSYHHQTLGTVERSHRTLNEYLRSYLDNGRTDWDDWLAYFTYCYNTTPSIAIKDYCPYQLIFGKTPAIYDFLNSDYIDPVYNMDDYHREVKFRLQIATQRAHKHLVDSKIKRKDHFDKTAKPQLIEFDDLVLLEIGNRHKLDPLFKGPYKIKDIIDSNVVLIDSNEKEKLVHKDRIKKFNKCFYFRFLDI